MKALLFGIVDEGDGYPRLKVILNALRYIGFKVERLVFPCFGPSKERILRNPYLALKALSRVAAARRKLETLARKTGKPDLILLGYPSHLIGALPRRIWPDVPILNDMFLSAYDTAIVDRGLGDPLGIMGRFFKFLDRNTAKSGDVVLLDTEEMCDYVADLTGLSRERFAWVPCGDPEAPESVEDYRPPRPGERFKVLFFGTDVPLHGLEHIIKAIKSLEDIEFTIIGGSGDRDFSEDTPDRRIIHIRNWVYRRELGAYIRKTHLVLGIFGKSDKADRVVPLKVYNGLSEGRPVLTGKSRAVARMLRCGREILVCERGDWKALAYELERLRRQPGLLEHVAREGSIAFRHYFSVPAIAERLGKIMDEMLASKYANIRT